MIFPADISPLSFPPVGEMQFTLRSVKDLEMQFTLRSVKDLEMQITLVLSKTWRCRLLWFCQRLGDADYSGSVKDLEMQVALCY